MAGDVQLTVVLEWTPHALGAVAGLFGRFRSSATQRNTQKPQVTEAGAPPPTFANDLLVLAFKISCSEFTMANSQCTMAVVLSASPPPILNEILNLAPPVENCVLLRVMFDRMFS